jgi:cyclomaltodextrinase / maltogenic alpha-amylase / neopullulanase
MRKRLFIGLLLGGLLLAACTDSTSDVDPSETQPALAPIAFDSADFDSYAATQEVLGRADCDDVSLAVNGQPEQTSVEINGTSFIATVGLSAGQNEVVASCQTSEGTVESEPLSIRRRVHIAPKARIDVTVAGGVVTFDAEKSQPSPDGKKITGYEWSAEKRRVDRDPPGPLQTVDGKPFKTAKGPTLKLAAPSDDGEYFVSLEVTDGDGTTDKSVTYFVVEGGVAREVDLQQEHPAWIDKAVIYAPIPALWGNDGPKTVEKKLPYLKDLGVDALWLWPPATLRTTGEEYAIDDYFDVDPDWGPAGALKHMVDEAHRLGMYVMLDFVPNHMSAESPYYQDTVANGELSSYWDFYDRKPNGEPTHYFDWTNLPNLNYDNPEVRTMIMEASAYWVRDIGIDGFRVDVAWGVKKRRPDFWLDWRREMKRIEPDLLLLAEASAVDPYYFDNGFDVAYDWTKELGHWAWQSSFEFPQEAGTLLTTAITNGGKGYSDDAIIMRFLNNNDTGVRFVDQHDAKMTRVASTMQFTLPGVPEMFAGDEIGASYEPYSNLTPIPWKDKHNLREHYRRLIEMKHTMPVLAGNKLDMLESNTGSVLAYVRPSVSGEAPVLVVLNYGPKTKASISGAGLAQVTSAGPGLTDLLTNEPVDWSGGGDSITFNLPGSSAYVLVPGGE